MIKQQPKMCIVHFYTKYIATICITFLFYKVYKFTVLLKLWIFSISSDPDSNKVASKPEEDEDEDFNQDDDAASSWLTSMGLDKESFPSLDPRRIKLYPWLDLLFHQKL